jgi:hypothetical protein
MATSDSESGDDGGAQASDGGAQASDGGEGTVPTPATPPPIVGGVPQVRVQGLANPIDIE